MGRLRESILYTCISCFCNLELYEIRNTCFLH
nr:MAG TPA: hypothetical protein [Caudoviricetes sp.]